MAPKKNYSRYFIILQEDEKGFALDKDKVPSGYVKLEKKNSKCKISYYAQNLNLDKQPYHLVLICNKKDVKALLKVSKVSVDEFGRIDISNEYDLNNIADSKIGMDKIIGAAIVKMIDKSMVSIMCGFTSSDTPKEWKNYSVLKDKRAEETEEENIFDEYENKIEEVKVNNEEVRGEMKEESKEEVKEEIKDEHIEETKNQHREEINVEEINEIKEKEVKEIKDRLREEIKQELRDEIKQELREENNVNEEKELSNNDEVNKEKHEVREELVRQSEVDERKKHKQKEGYKEELDVDKEKDYPIGMLGDFFKSLVDGFKKEDHMTDEIKHCKWYSMKVNSIEDMYDMSDFDKYTVLYYPMLSYYAYIQKYGHYCVGYKCDEKGKMKYLVYAIPGDKMKEDQPYGGKTGFVTWIPCKNRENNGYWLLFYDIRKSCVVVPVKKK